MKQYDLVIFDWDGTLMDSIGKIVTCMQASAVELDLEAPCEQSVRDIIGLSMDKALHTLFPQGTAVVYHQMMTVYRKHYLELDTTPSPLYDGSIALLDSLTTQGYQLAVATGKARAGLNRVLAASELGHYFAASRCADESKSKPEPQMIFDILSELAIAPERAVMIGDSIHDLNMANNAGVDGIGVSYGAHNKQRLMEANPVQIVDSPLSLLTHL